MNARADVSSFEAIDAFRASLAEYIATANAALASAEVETMRTLGWLENEQVPYWKSAVRAAAKRVEECKAAYREKSLYKDATGMRHSAIDERRALARAVAHHEDCERRAAATRRQIIRLQREIMVYKAGVQRLTATLNGDLVRGLAELTHVLDALDRYVAARPEPATSSFAPQAGAPRETSRATDESDSRVTEIERLRQHTPSSATRAKAPRAAALPALPVVPPAAREAAQARLHDDPLARYDLLTLSLPSSTQQGVPTGVYLERREPVSAADTGWHIGHADGPNAPGAGACLTITVGRLADAAPDLAELLRLPLGTLIVARGGAVGQIVDPLGRTVWRRDER